MNGNKTGSVDTYNLRSFVWSITVIMVALCFINVALAAMPEWMDLQGYTQYLETVAIPDHAHILTTGSMLQNRTDVKVYPHELFIGALSLRTRLQYGSITEQLNKTGYASALARDNGLFDASVTLWDNDAAVLHLMADRLYLDFSKNNFQMRIGRHRINWGKNLIWNPNDIFNAYSILDIVYPEQPGTDAFLLRYYTGPVSSLEGAVGFYNKGDTLNAALLWCLNVNEWDMQVLVGWSRSDFVCGIGFSGQVKGMALRGEGTFFQPDSFTHLNKITFVGSISADYMFIFKLYSQISLLYNSAGTTNNAGNGSFTHATTLITVKHLTPSRIALFGQLQYPITPLLHVDLSWIGNPFDRSMVFTPQITYSLTDNLDVNLISQLFYGDPGTEFGVGQKFVYGSLQLNF